MTVSTALTRTLAETDAETVPPVTLRPAALRHHYLVLGLDPGIASCGFCLLDMTDCEILEMGAHLFRAPQEAKTKISLAASRRNARSARRNNQRSKARLTRCLDLLKEAGLVPADADKRWLQTAKGDIPVLELRSQGLDRLLTGRELAQVLYNLCSRRGYIPHGEGRGTDDAEGKKVITAIKKNTEQMNESGHRTVGELLESRGRSRNRSGDYGLCVLNSQICDEAHAVIAAQRALGATSLAEGFENEYLTCLSWEKKTADHDERVYDQVGACVYFPSEKRAAASDVSSERVRAYERLGHLAIVDADGSESMLTSEQIQNYIDILFSTAPITTKSDPLEVTYKRIRSDLNLDATSVFKGVDLDKEKSSEVFSPRAWRCFRKTLPEGLLRRMLADRTLGDDICECLAYASSEESLAQQLAVLDLADDEFKAVMTLPFTGRLFNSYGTRSRQALEMLLDAFKDENVRTLTDAEKATGLFDQRLADTHPRMLLLPPYSDYDPTCTNPVVLRSMGRMRRIVNAVIRIYGPLDEIHIELGRDLKRSKKEKARIAKRASENNVTNKRLSEVAAAILGCASNAVPGKVIRKLAFHEEQGGIDFYTGEVIDLERLVKEDRYCQIDHILPYSRTCDDSRANKVLVLAKNNQDKRERTPYEWMSSGETCAPDWNEFQARVMNGVRWFRKREKLLNTDLGPQTEAKFIARNLNDDRYMSVAVKNYLENCLLFPEDGRKRHVTAVSGGATAALRHVWHLNFGDNGEKDRTDDRHHAVDAAIIAACSESTMKKIADASKLGRETFKHLRQSRLADTQPWPAFAEEVIERREHVIPTRMADHSVTGRAFEDTLYHLDGFSEDKGRYPLVRAHGKISKKGNVRINPDDSVRLVDGLAFIRLWHDPTARPTGKTKGKWYAEPVYYADIPDIKAGTYVPRACAIHVARINWAPVPAAALASKPVTVFFGDVLQVDGHIGRFAGFNISSNNMKMRSLIDKSDIKDWPSFGSWGNETTVSVFEEDCLGHCYDDIALEPNCSTFTRR